MVNDELNNVFTKYERYMKNRQGEGVDKSGSGSTGHSSGQLIDLGSGGNEAKRENLSAQLAGISVGGSKNVSQVPNVSGQGANDAIQDEFDMFSQSRSANYANTKQRFFLLKKINNRGVFALELFFLGNECFVFIVAALTMRIGKVM